MPVSLFPGAWDVVAGLEECLCRANKQTNNKTNKTKKAKQQQTNRTSLSMGSESGLNGLNEDLAKRGYRAQGLSRRVASS